MGWCGECDELPMAGVGLAARHPLAILRDTIVHGCMKARLYVSRAGEARGLDGRIRMWRWRR